MLCRLGLVLGLWLVVCPALTPAVGAGSVAGGKSSFVRQFVRDATVFHLAVGEKSGFTTARGENTLLSKVVQASYYRQGGSDAAVMRRIEPRAVSEDRSVDLARGPEAEREGLLMPGDWFSEAFPVLSGRGALMEGLLSNLPYLRSGPALVRAARIRDLLMPGSVLRSVGAFPAGPEGDFSHLEIEVSHSEHTLKLYGISYFGHKTVLFRCRVGLGAPVFPTPVGEYFVTHIYDDNPWWIPPANRAWAFGQSPSRRVYGGTMAPLLKKRFVRSRKRIRDLEDLIANKVRLDDYGYRFHGTNAPRSIGRNQSHGCVRMLPKDAKKLAGYIKEYVGISGRGESENGSFATLKAPVRLHLVK